MSFFAVKNITAAYDGNPVVKNVSFESGRSVLTGILGANGSGKTTLLKAICGVLPHGGECKLDGERLEGLSPRQLALRCSYIPQRSGISIDISAMDVVLMGFNPRLGLLEQPGAAMRRIAVRALEAVGLGERAEDNYLTLSEGQKQLCILARTLVSNAKLLLLDEPESALDFRYRHRMLRLLKNWLSGGKRSAVVTLHDPQLALQYCDQLVLLHGGSIAGVLRPQTDALVALEEALECIYGSVSLIRCPNRSGEEQLIMLKEREEYA